MRCTFGKPLAAHHIFWGENLKGRRILPGILGHCGCAVIQRHSSYTLHYTSSSTVL